MRTTHRQRAQRLQHVVENVEADQHPERVHVADEQRGVDKAEERHAYRAVDHTLLAPDVVSQQTTHHLQRRTPHDRRVTSAEATRHPGESKRT